MDTDEGDPGPGMTWVGKDECRPRFLVAMIGDSFEFMIFLKGWPRIFACWL